MTNSVIFLLLITGMLIGLPSNALAQAVDGWTNYTSEKCNVSFEYPSNWTLKIKRGPFDTNMRSEIEFYNPELDLTGLYPAFSVGACVDLENMKQAQRTTKLNPFVGQFLGNDSIKDAKSLSMFTQSILALLSSAFSMASTDLQINIVEPTRICAKVYR